MKDKGSLSSDAHIIKSFLLLLLMMISLLFSSQNCIQEGKRALGSGEGPFY
jgi:hypothetical protein